MGYIEEVVQDIKVSLALELVSACHLDRAHKFNRLKRENGNALMLAILKAGMWASGAMLSQR